MMALDGVRSFSSSAFTAVLECDIPVHSLASYKMIVLHHTYFRAYYN